MDVKETDQDLWQIGEFSRLTRISIRMLRHYQERSLLQPAWTDPFTGYRFYGGAELMRAMRIRELRDVGLPIDEIAQALTLDDAGVITILEAHGNRLSHEAKKTAQQMAAVRRLVQQIEDPVISQENVIRKTVPAHVRAALRKIIPNYGHEGDLWQEFMPLIGKVGISWGPDTVVGASFYDPDYKETDCDVEIWMTVPEPFTPSAPLQCQTVPEFEAISITVTGSYDSTIGPASDILAAYADRHGLKPAMMYNVYVVGPGSGVSPDEYVTEVCSQILPD